MGSTSKRIEKSLFSSDLIAELEGKRNRSEIIDWTEITNKPQLADSSWRSPVATFADLPASGNSEGDVRLVLSDRGVYEFKAGAWDFVGANDTNIDWTSVQSKPTTFPPSAHTHTLDEVTETTTKKIMTDTERTKLTGVAANANNYIHPATHPADMITETTTKKLMTDVERTKLAGVADSANNYVHPATHPASIIVEAVDKRFMLDAERTKLTGVEANANNYVHPSTHSATMIVEDSTHRFATDAEKTTWNGKADGAAYNTHVADTSIHHTHSNKAALDKVAYSGVSATLDLKQIETNQSDIASKVSTSTFTGHTGNTTIHVTQTDKDSWNGKAPNTIATTTADGLMVAADKSKLDGVAAGANNYVHPANHPPSIITQDASNRFVTDTEKTTWNGKASTAAVTTSANGLMIASDKSKLDGVAANANNYTHPSGDGNLHVPATGTTNSTKVLRAGATAGSLSWGAVAWTEVTGKPTTFAPSAHTHLPADVTQDASNRFVTDMEKSTWNAKQAALGFTPENSANKGVASGYAELDVNGLLPDARISSTFVTQSQLSASGGGDMMAATYDPDGDGKVVSAVNADAVPWTGVSSKPTTFAPSAHTHLWADLTDKPSTFAPSAHTHAATDVTQTASYRFVTDTEKTTWNGKASTSVVTTTVNGLMSSGDKAKLDGVATGANNYVHPANHPPSIITQDASNRFVTDTEKSTWNGKADASALTSHTSAGSPHTDHVKGSTRITVSTTAPTTPATNDLWVDIN